MTELAPSILSSDFSDLKNEIKKVKNADYLHLDVMDGNFVPNISFGPGLIKSLRSHSDLVYDTHLMIETPEKYIKDFVRAGSDFITVHVETTKHLYRAIQQIKENDCRAGVALNPATSLKEVENILTDIDLLLIMTVNPGFGGQELISEMFNKIKQAASIINKNKYGVKIAVDGGVKLNNLHKFVENGSDIIVAGSAIFNAKNPKKKVESFKNKLNQLKHTYTAKEV